MSNEKTITRRGLLGAAGAAGAAGLVAGGAGGAVAAQTLHDDLTALASVGAATVPFHGDRQAGITTPLQAHGHLIAFDLAAGTGRKGAAALLRRWSAAAEAMTAGRVPSGDNQIALDAGPSSLTVTFGFGRTFFAKAGLDKQLPGSLAPLPDFSSDELVAAHSNGDLWVQIGSDDGLVAFHALRIVQKEAGDAARLRWQMNGFNRTPGATAEPRTARNLMGQIDGTNNPKPSEPTFDRRIFVPESGSDGSPEWMAGGSYAVVRRIRMLLDSWDNLSLERQEKVIGRRKSDGAPSPPAPAVRRRPPSTSTSATPTTSSPSRPTPTYASPSPSPTAAPPYSAAPGPTTTASATTAPPTPACSSSAGSPTPSPASSPSSASSTAATGCPATCDTSPVRSSPYRAARPRASTWASASWRRRRVRPAQPLG